jgi:hypothetical protein
MYQNCAELFMRFVMKLYTECLITSKYEMAPLDIYFLPLKVLLLPNFHTRGKKGVLLYT